MPTARRFCHRKRQGDLDRGGVTRAEAGAAHAAFSIGQATTRLAHSFHENSHCIVADFCRGWAQSFALDLRLPALSRRFRPHGNRRRRARGQDCGPAIAFKTDPALGGQAYRIERAADGAIV